MQPTDTPPPPRPHRRKFSDGLLDNALILDSLDIRPGQVIVDAGCGNGYMARLFADRVGPTGRVIALDIAEEFLGPLRAEARPVHLEVVKSDITWPTGLEESSVDVVYISTVVHVFSKERFRGFVTEAGRILKPGGLLGVLEMEKKPTSFGPPLSQRYSPPELRRAIPLTPVKTVSAAEYFYLQIFRNEVG